METVITQEEQTSFTPDAPKFGVHYNEENIINSINGSVYRSGLKIDIRDWLDCGSINYKSTPLEVRKAAYKAATEAGWTNEALISTMCKTFAHLDDFTVRNTIQNLQ